MKKIKIQIKNRFTGSILFEYEAENNTIKKTVGNANLNDANLRYANLRDADLRCADLSGVDLSYADLNDADLNDADLSGSNLRDADLRCANLNDADLNGTNLDFTGFNLSCKTLKIKCNKKLASQLLYHFCRLNTEDKEVQKVQKMLSVKNLANQFHRVEECGKL